MQRQIQPTNARKKAIGLAVAEFRRRAVQEPLSHEFGFERTCVSRVERGILNPTTISRGL